MKSTGFLILMLVSVGALAAPPSPQPPPAGAQQAGPPAMTPERMEKMEKRMRLMQVVGLSETLGLSTQEALKLDETLRRFDDRRRPLRMQVHDSARVLMMAARGDNSVMSQVDQATNRILDARIQLATIDREQFQTLARDLNSQQRAKLAIFYGKLHRGGRQMMRMMMRAGEMGGGEMRRMRGGGQLGMTGGSGEGPMDDDADM